VTKNGKKITFVVFGHPELAERVYKNALFLTRCASPVSAAGLRLGASPRREAVAGAGRFTLYELATAGQRAKKYRPALILFDF